MSTPQEAYSWLGKFNKLCEELQKRGLLERFQSALHEHMFSGKTHLGEYNMIHAIQSSYPEDWEEVLIKLNIKLENKDD